MHRKYLLAALAQAQLGRGFCSPNPSVGAVALQNGKIIAQAYHKGAGNPHAEQVLLTQFPANTPGVSLYVTLEPCNHWGKTPPCVDAIIQHDIEQVIYGYADPNQVVSLNNTPKRLQENNIRVIFHPIPEIQAFYQSYHYWLRTQKPWVTVKMAHTLDGKIAGMQGERMQLSNALCAEYTHTQRLQTDIILTSAKTLNQDDPLLNARTPSGDEAKPLAVIDRRLSANPKARALVMPRRKHIFYGEGNPEPKDPETLFYPILQKDNRLDLEQVLRHLGELGYHDVWVEAGGAIFSALHANRLVQRTILYTVPTFLGQNALSAYRHLESLTWSCKMSSQVVGDNTITCLDWQEENICLQE
jgi:diaminohydroxyphosphoribosylaminopyrimidine deaminase / 5-amino-6-(5-phosphoribosylamino)uracil reductase